jgi:hypothetical protein
MAEVLNREHSNEALELSPAGRLWRHPFKELKARRALRRQIAELNPETHYHLLSKLVVGHVFSDAFFVDTLFTVAYWRQIAVRTIAPVLHQNGKGKTYETAKRVDDTLLFFGFIYRDGWQSMQAGATIDRLAAIHERFAIPPDDFRYTAASLCFEAVRIPEILGLRVLTDAEARALFLFWRDVGRRWGIDIPEEQAEFRAWMEGYERAAYERTPEGPAMAKAMGDDYCRRFFPGPFKRIGYTILRCCSDRFLLDSVGQPYPWVITRKVVGALIRVYVLLRRLVPASSGPQLLRPWNNEYGAALDPMVVGPEWTKKIAPKSRRFEKAGRCPITAVKALVGVRAK